jgi:hypothetical protein
VNGVGLAAIDEYRAVFVFDECAQRDCEKARQDRLVKMIHNFGAGGCPRNRYRPYTVAGTHLDTLAEAPTH